MRTLLVVVFLVIFALLSIILLPLLKLIELFNKKLSQRISQNIVRVVLGYILFLSGTKKRVIGLDRIPRDRAVLFAINHRGFFDVVIALNTVPVLSGFVSKIEIKKIPLLNIWMKNLNCVFIDRNNPREGIKAILKGIEFIKNGTSMFIAPEGTRNRGDGLLEFKQGSLKIASKTGCPIVPVAITNADRVLEMQFPLIKKEEMTIEYGEPIYLESLSEEEKKELTSLVKNRVWEMYRRNLA